MAHSPESWIFVGSSIVLFLFVGECLNAYSVNTPKQTALSQVFHAVIGLIGTTILVSVFGVSIVLCFFVVFFCLAIFIIYLAFTALEIAGLSIVVAMAIGCIGYALETIALTLVGPRLEIAAVKNLIRTGIKNPIRALSTCFVPLLVSLPWHEDSTTAPESPLRLTFGTGMRFYFSFRATLQKKFPPHWKPRPYWGDGLEGDFGVYPFSQKHLNPVLTGIHNQLRLKAAETGGFFGNGIDCDFQFRPASQDEPLESIFVQYRRIPREQFRSYEPSAMQNMSSDPRLESRRENRRQMLQI